MLPILSKIMAPKNGFRSPDNLTSGYHVIMPHHEVILNGPCTLLYFYIVAFK